jgi:D-xylose transport system ATP-binding protein
VGNGRPVLQLRAICKRFGAVQALTEVNLELHAGEVVALIGDNGAGKSTLAKVIAGVAPADSGEIRWQGEPVTIRHPSDGQRLGIATVYQDLALCDNLDVVANLFLGAEKGSGGMLDGIEMERRARALLRMLSVRIAGLERGLAVPLESAAARGDDDLEALADRMLGGRPHVGDDDVTLLLAEVGAASTEALAAPHPAGGSGTTYGVW